MLRYLTDAQRADRMKADVRAGLTATPKALPPVYFYDAAGSELFERITELPEYYPTRAERAILTAHANDIAKLSAADTLIELGSGSSDKTRLLLDALREAGTLRRYVPVDVSESALAGAADALRADYPSLEIEPIVADFGHHLHLLPESGSRLVAFLGGTIGNLVPEERAQFLSVVRTELTGGDMLLLGTDLVKDAARLVAAYDDGAGVTAAFNRNVLYAINAALDADFDPTAFDHVAIWDAEHEWMEMRLRARTPQTVHVAGLDLTVRFDAGEEMRTEISAKFRRETAGSELAAAGLDVVAWWTDPAGDFALSLSTPR